MYAAVINTKNKGSSLPMALRVVATERAVSFTNTALRRGETRTGAGPVVESFKYEFASKCGAGYIESFDAENRSFDPKVGQSQKPRKAPQWCQRSGLALQPAVPPESIEATVASIDSCQLPFSAG